MVNGLLLHSHTVKKVINKSRVQVRELALMIVSLSHQVVMMVNSKKFRHNLQSIEHIYIIKEIKVTKVINTDIEEIAQVIPRKEK